MTDGTRDLKETTYGAQMRVGDLFYKGILTVRELVGGEFAWHFTDIKKDFTRTVLVEGPSAETEELAYRNAVGLHGVTLLAERVSHDR